MAPDDTVLLTERMRLRSFRVEDLDALWAIQRDPQTMHWYPHPFARGESEAWIQRNIERHERDGHGLWATELLEDGRFAGSCGLALQQVDGESELEAGWMFDRSLWNRGLATEAGRACRDLAFGPMGRTRLISLVRPDNVASCRVAEKLGMTVEKETMHARLRHHVYAMTPVDVEA
ncbi:MAG: GNAT family N-acetyltransferase [Actinobacteria bacterium]|nr:GNAT family N-acetyltransferase [Actinomycetota bacterium]